VFELLGLLSQTERAKFIRELDLHWTAEDLLDLLETLPRSEQAKVTYAFINPRFDGLMVQLMEMARRVLFKKYNIRGIVTDDLTGELQRLHTAFADEFVAGMTEHDAQVASQEEKRVKFALSRKPDPKNVERNLRVCLSKHNPKSSTTNGQLARYHGVDESMIRQILRDEPNLWALLDIYIQICDRNQGDPPATPDQLANDFGMNLDEIGRILEKDAAWRQLLSDRRSN
jgi:hypothetical protein